MTTTFFFPQQTPDAFSASSATFKRLLSKRRLVPSDVSIAPMDRLAMLLGVKDIDAIPWAALLANGEGLSLGEGYYIWLEPVQLTALRGTLVLQGTRELPIPEYSHLATELALSVQAHNWEVHVTPKGQFVLYSRQPMQVASQPWWRAWGQDIRGFLPSGDDVRLWSRLFNEWQMTLHMALRPTSDGQHALPTANALWPWGGGILTRPPQVQARLTVYCDTPYGGLLAEWLGLPCRSVSQFLEEPAEQSLVVLGEGLPERVSTIQYPPEYIEKLVNYCERTRAPIVFADGTQALSRGGSWAFWRK